MMIFLPVPFFPFYFFASAFAFVCFAAGVAAFALRFVFFRFTFWLPCGEIILFCVRLCVHGYNGYCDSFGHRYYAAPSLCFSLLHLLPLI